MTSRHLLVDVSAHGLGHLAQVAPVVCALRRRQPGLRVTVRGALDPARVRGRLATPVEVVREDLDVNLAMASAVEVLAEASHRAYVDFHRDWGPRVAATARDLQRLAPDLVLADVPYLSLAGAGAAGIPAVALCSLNWGDIYRTYCAGMPGSARVLEQIREAYGQAALFLQPRPHMPMADIPARRSIAPIANPGTPRREPLQACLGIPPGRPVVLIGLGGMDLRLPVETWAPALGAHWLVPARWGVSGADISAIEDCALGFSDLLASVDLLVAKPGYGTFAEAAAAGVPVLYVERPDWPETPHLTAWLAAHVPCASLARDALDGPQVPALAARMLATGRPNPLSFHGEEEAADHLLPFLT